MLAGLIALIVAALFAGAALYINIAEHPARMGLPLAYALQQWRPSYARGFAMQAALAIVGGVAAGLQWYLSGTLLWLVGGALLLANWPFTMLVIMPVNHQLHAAEVESSGRAAALLRQWGRLHAVRTVLGFLSVGVLLLAALG